MNGWDEFEAYMRDVRARMEDRWAPIGLICLQAIADDEGMVQVLPNNDAAILWPASMPISERGPLLERLAKPYRDGTVLR
jgi:hypothetical protein